MEASDYHGRGSGVIVRPQEGQLMPRKPAKTKLKRELHTGAVKVKRGKGRGKS